MPRKKKSTAAAAKTTKSKELNRDLSVADEVAVDVQVDGKEPETSEPAAAEDVLAEHLPLKQRASDEQSRADVISSNSHVEGECAQEPSESATSLPSHSPAAAPADLSARLLQLRMKINQGRRSNQAEVEEEFNRLNQSGRRKMKQSAEDEEDATNQRKNKPSEIDILLNQTAAEAEWEASKSRQKAETAATYGLNAFTSEAYYRAYEKKVKKLQTTARHSAQAAAEGSSSAVSSRGSSALVEFGDAKAKVTDKALDRLKADVIAKEADRMKFSKRRTATDGADVDYINDKNATFNKRLKKSFDKYTVEIRQNLERGTAI